MAGGGQDNNANGNKRKRRRNRNRKDRDTQSSPMNNSSTSIDVAELKRRAWKIFLGEVNEEGLALMDERISAEAARRAFSVAECFLVEAALRALPEDAQDNDQFDIVDELDEFDEQGE